MLPVIAIIGRPNVGKSTLFNRLTRSQQALVADLPGVTRDRLYGEAKWDGQRFLVIDTGGLTEEKKGIEHLMAKQAWQAVEEANIILFVLDARSGLTAIDSLIARQIRASGKPVFLVINKSENLDKDLVLSEFAQLGFANNVVISAAHAQGINDLMAEVLPLLPTEETMEIEPDRIKIAIVGRPNVGKSTLVNRMLGEERVLVYDMPGTTRDSIYIPFERQEKKYMLIDTAGVRRRRAVTEALEKFSIIKTLQAIDAANVVIMVMDAQESITEQDLRLLGFIIEAGKALVIAVNKWDDLETQQREYIRNEMDRRLDFVNFAHKQFISALHGTGVGDLYRWVDESYEAAMKLLPTPELTRLLEKAVASHQPPAFRGHEIKLRYAHAGGHNPPVLVIHGKRTKNLPVSYQRYLMNFFRDALNLVGTPIRIVLKED